MVWRGEERGWGDWRGEERWGERKKRRGPVSAAVLYFSVEVVRRDHLFTLIHSSPCLILLQTHCVSLRRTPMEISSLHGMQSQHNITKANIGIFPLSYDVIMSHNKQHVHTSHSYIIWALTHHSRSPTQHSRSTHAASTQHPRSIHAAPTQHPRKHSRSTHASTHASIHAGIHAGIHASIHASIHAAPTQQVSIYSFIHVCVCRVFPALEDDVEQVLKGRSNLNQDTIPLQFTYSKYKNFWIYILSFLLFPLPSPFPLPIHSPSSLYNKMSDFTLLRYILTSGGEGCLDPSQPPPRLCLFLVPTTQRNTFLPPSLLSSPLLFSSSFLFLFILVLGL